MPYTVLFPPILDLAGFYVASLPTLVAVVNTPLGPPLPATATATPASFSLVFPTLTNPPAGPGTMLVTDPGGPGDFFRSGVLKIWPVAPASLVAGTAVKILTYDELTSGLTTPIEFDIDGGIGAAIGAATGFNFVPFHLKLTSINIFPSRTPGAVGASFRGIISFATLVVPRHTDIAGSMDLTLSPSGDASHPDKLLSISASNLSLEPGFIDPLTTPVLALLAPAFSGAFSSPLTKQVNKELAPVIAAARAKLPTTPGGAPLFSAAATVSVRRVTVTRSGVGVQVVLAELIATLGWASGIRAAILWNNGKAYFFRGNQYIRYDVAADRVDPGYPINLPANWPGLWSDRVDAAVMWNNGKAYFFRGSEYIRYDVARDQTDPGYPRPIAGNWPGLWPDGVDAAILWNNSTAYFFKGSQYVRYDVAADRVMAGYPMPIAGHWPGLFTDGIDAAVMWNDGKAYFFRGTQYARYDVALDKVDPGYPQPIVGNWHGF